MQLFEINSIGFITTNPEADNKAHAFVVNVTGAFKILNSGLTDYHISFPVSFVGEITRKEQEAQEHYLWLKCEEGQWIFANNILHKFIGIAFRKVNDKQEVWAVVNPTIPTSDDYDKVFDGMSEVWAALKPENVTLYETLNASQHGLSKFACKR